MKFWAKVGIEDKRNAENLILAFFEEFNPESSFFLKGKEAKMKIVFEKDPPKELIKAISQCDAIELIYGEVSDEHEKTVKCCANASDEQTSEDTEQDGIPRSAKRNTRTQKADIKNIQILDEIANHSESFEDFVKKISKWLEMGKRQETFMSLVFATTEVTKVSWEELTRVLESKGISYTQWDKVWITRKISEKLKEYSITGLQLFKLLISYKNNSFKRKVKMDCMPEIPNFEEALEGIDSSKTIEERVQYVLQAMGLEELDMQSQQFILEIANIAVEKEVAEIESILKMSSIPQESHIKARMIFSQFINEFANKYDANKKIKLWDFITQLRTIIMEK